MKYTTEAAAATRPTDSPTPLGLSHVLTDLLPHTVHTPQGPERYTVPAVFTRRPTPGEVDALNGDVARAALAGSPFPHVSLAVSDRRLEIENTNLEELSAGLATVVADLLAQISAAEAERAHAVADQLVGIEANERLRHASVVAVAEQVRFTFTGAATTGQGTDASPLGLTGVDSAQLDPTIGTAAEPVRYTVVARFTRPPTRTELALLGGPLPRERFDAAGYTAAALKTRDRHLEIRGTSLSELESGLAGVIAQVMADIGTQAARQDDRARSAAAGRAESEHERADYVAGAAAAIAFRPSTAPVAIG